MHPVKIYFFEIMNKVLNYKVINIKELFAFNTLNDTVSVASPKEKWIDSRL